MAELYLEHNYRAVQTLTSLDRLIGLDDVWTHYLDTAQDIPRSDVETLRTLTDEMQSLLRDMLHAAERLRGLISGREREFEDAVLDVIRQSRLTEEDKEGMQRIFDRHGGVVGLARVAIERLLSRGVAIGEEIAAKMRRIEEGGFVPGDLPKNDRWVIRVVGFLSGAAEFALFGGLHLVAGLLSYDRFQNIAGGDEGTLDIDVP